MLRQGEQSIGIEISVTTSVEHEIANLKKCAGLGFTRILFVSAEKKKRELVAGLAEELRGSCPLTALAPDDIVPTLDALAAPPTQAESVVRGYTVRVSRQQIRPEDAIAKRKAVAQVMRGTSNRAEERSCGPHP